MRHVVASVRCTRFVLAGLATLASPLIAQDRAPPAPWLDDCPLETPGGGTVDAWCGTYEVWENRETMAGRRIALNVLVVPARSESPAPDVVTFLHGGPGGAATEVAGGITMMLDALRDTRDLLFVDQRGTGSSHPLDCEPPPPDAPLQIYFDEFLEPDDVRRCLARQDADVSLYASPPAMDDVDEIRTALGYEAINLFGGSYGTRAALVYLRRHAPSVRTAVLKGVAPTNMKNPLPFARAAEEGVAAVLAACAAEAPCHEAYPDLEEDWRRTLAHFEQGPVTADVKHPRTGKAETVTITKGVFADGIRHILYGVQASTILPTLIHAAGTGDFSVFADRELRQTMGFANMLSMGVFLSVTCSEDLPFLTEDEIKRETDGTFLGDYRIRRQLAACDVWRRADVGEDFIAPVRVSTPTLLLSGQYDTATPPEGAEWVASHLPNALHVVFPNQSHNFANPQCEIGLITEFIRSGSVEGLDASCAASTRRPPFQVGSGASR
jgi:pimeloyl-ACP methyl ester carboxylesterase